MKLILLIAVTMVALLMKADEGSTLALPSPTKAVPEEFFGMHAGFPTDSNPYAWPGAWVKFGSYRLWDTEDVGWSFIQRVGPRQIESVKRINNVVTVTTKEDHDMIAGANQITVTLTDVHDRSFNGTFSDVSAQGARSFTFPQRGPDHHSEGGRELASDWTKLDGAIAKARDKQTLYTFGAVPLWAARAEPAPVQIASLSRVGSLYTLKTVSPHRFRFSPAYPQWVAVSDMTDQRFDGVFTLKSVPDERTLAFNGPVTNMPEEGEGGKVQLFDRGGGSDSGTLLGTHLPRGASTALEPDPQLFQDFLTQLVSRYCNRKSLSAPGLHIDGYEIWNEPNASAEYGGVSFFVPIHGRTVEDSAAAMVPLAQIVWNTVKRIDPNAKIVSPAASGDRTSNGVQWVDRFLDDGGAKFFDVLGYHFYVGEHSPEAMLPVIRDLQDSLRRHGTSKPIWDTEIGWGGNQEPLGDLGPGYVARTFLLSWAAGVSRVYWYQWNSQCWAKLRMTTSQTAAADCGSGRTLTGTSEAAMAYAETQKEMVNSHMKSCALNAETWVCQMVLSSGRNVWALWTVSDNATFSLPLEWHATRAFHWNGTVTSLADLKKVEVSSTPIFVQ